MIASTEKARRIFTIVIAACVLFALGGCDRFKTAEGLFQDAEARYKNGEEKAAIIQLKAVLQKEPNHGPARLLSARVNNDVGQFATAEKDARKALASGMLAEQVALELSRSLVGQGKFQDALNEAKLSPGLTGEVLAKVLVVRGNAQLFLRQKEAAKTSYEAAVQVAEKYYGGYMGKARWAAIDKNEPEAMQQIDIALQLAPKSVEALILKGDLFRAAGKNDEAANTYRGALKVKDSDIDARLRLASVLLAADKLDQARVEIDLARKIAPDNVMAIYIAAVIDFREGKYAQARDNIQRVLRVAPDHLPSAVLFGAVSYQLGAYEQAEKMLSYAVGHLPDNAFPRRLLVSTLIKRNETARAIKMLQPLLAKYPNDAIVLGLAGEAYLAGQDPKRATGYFEKAALSADNSVVRSRLAVSMLAGGETERGIAELEKASNLDAKQFQADTLLIVTLMRLQQFDKALAAIDVLEKKQPNSPLAHNLRGGAYLGKGDRVSARKNYDLALAVDPAFIDAAANLAQMDMQDKNPAAAKSRFEKVLAKDKANIRAMLALADLAVAGSKESEYLSWVEKAAKTDVTAFEPKARLVAYYLGKKENQKAIALATEAQATNPDSAPALELLGRVQLVVGQKETARTSYRRLAEILPDTAASHYRLGLAQLQFDQLDIARVSLRRALELKPDFGDAAAALIGLEMRQQKVQAALQVARNLQRDTPKSGYGWALEAELLAGQRRPDEALLKYEKAQSLEPKGDIAIRLHQLRLADKPSDANTGLIQWLKLHPDDINARVYFAGSLLARKQHKAAVEQYEFITQKAPTNALILNNLAVAYNEIGDGRAMPTAEQAVKLSPKNPALQDTLGWILLSQGQIPRAKEVLQQASAAMPADPEIRYHYAAALAKVGDTVKARQELGLALKSDKLFASKPAAEALFKQLQ